MADTSMEDILSNKEPEAPKGEATEAPAEKAEAEVERVQSKRREHRSKEYEAQGRDPETGQFIAKEEKTEAPAKEPAEKAEAPKAEAVKEAPKQDAPKEEYTAKEKALLAEAARHKRRVQELEQLLAQPKAPPVEAPKPDAPKTLWDDPEAWKASIIAEQQKAVEEVRREALNTRMRLSEQLARSRYKDDFQPAIDKFNELVQTVPGLGQQFLQAPDPAEFAYRTAKSHMDIAAAGGVEQLIAEREAKARADERAKLEAEYKKRQEEAEKQRRELPGSISDVRGAATRASQVVFTGPPSMEEILKH